MKTVSLYIPCFNAEAVIARCINAVRKQTFPIKEVLVIDDGSVDNSAAIAARLCCRVMRHKKNLGLASARNTGIKNTNSDFIAALDADCIPKEKWLESLMKHFDDEKLGGVGGRLLEGYRSSACDFWRSVHMKQEWGEKVTNPPFLFGSNTVFRRKALVKVGLYRETLQNNYEDVDISRRMRRAGYALVYDPQARAEHLRQDTLASLFDTYWKWNFSYYQKRRYYTSWQELAFKIKDNMGLANRYLEEDIIAGRKRLMYLDFLLAIHHSLRDFEYFLSRRFPQNSFSDHPSRQLASWIHIVDLAVGQRLQTKNKIITLVSPKERFLQNFIALNLLIGPCLKNIFRNPRFTRLVYRHLLSSGYHVNDAQLPEVLQRMTIVHKQWTAFFKKKHPNLDKIFLSNTVSNFEEWLRSLTSRFAGIERLIENSAEYVQ